MTHRIDLLDLIQQLESPKCELAPQPQGFRDDVTMFDYQRRSLARMLEREEKPTLFTFGENSYLDFRGGVLADPMGSGKTLVCIALVLTTKHVRGLPDDIVAIESDTVRRALCEERRSLVAHNRFTNDFSRFSSSASNLKIEQSEQLRQSEQRIALRFPSLRNLCAMQLKTGRYRFARHWRNMVPLDVQEWLLYDLPQPYYWQCDRLPDAASAWSGSLRLSERSGVEERRVLIGVGTVIVVPALLLNQWRQELAKYVRDGELSVRVLSGDEARSDTLWAFAPDRGVELSDVEALAAATDELSRVDLILCTFAFLRGAGALAEPMRSVHFQRVIVDEGHIAGRTSQQAAVVRSLKAERRWACSGTPTPDSAQAFDVLRGLVELLGVEPFVRRDAWSALRRGGAELLRAVLQRIMVRTREADILRDVVLPPLSERLTLLQPSPLEALKYNEVVGQVRVNLICSEYEGVDSFMHAANFKFARAVLKTLRVACTWKPRLDATERYKAAKTALRYRRDVAARNGERTALQVAHSYWPLDVELDELRCDAATLCADMAGADAELSAYVDSLRHPHRLPPRVRSTKLDYLLARVTEAVDADHKVIVFSQLGETLYLVNVALTRAGIRYVRLDRGVPLAKRAQASITFNTSDSVAVIVVDVRLAGEGLNLPAASRVFFLEPLDDAARTSQAIKRAHRIGQYKPVLVEHILLANTIEDPNTRAIEQTTTRARIIERMRANGQRAEHTALVNELSRVAHLKLGHAIVDDEHAALAALRVRHRIAREALAMGKAEARMQRRRVKQVDDNEKAKEAVVAQRKRVVRFADEIESSSSSLKRVAMCAKCHAAMSLWRRSDNDSDADAYDGDWYCQLCLILRDYSVNRWQCAGCQTSSVCFDCVSPESKTNMEKEKKKQKKRKREKKRKDDGEQGREMKRQRKLWTKKEPNKARKPTQCSLCTNIGHNRRTCPMLKVKGVQVKSDDDDKTVKDDDDDETVKDDDDDKTVKDDDDDKTAKGGDQMIDDRIVNVESPHIREKTLLESIWD
jgi:SNF2-related domain/Helicase conserved C-terminal domain